jgi:hypothetical protein
MPVIASSPGTLSAGLNDAFFDTYRPSYKAMQARLSAIAEFIPSDKEQERFAFYESAPHPAIWRRGESIRHKNFKDQTWTVPNRDWGIAIDWHRNDREDDQTRSLRPQAESAGQMMANLDERVIFQVLQAATDTDLLPSIPTGADGSALCVTSTRFGASGGNTVTGSGVAAGSAIATDFHAAVARMMQFQDTEGQPLWDPGIFDQGFLVIFNSNNLKVFNEAFLQQVTALGPNTAQSNAGVSNIIVAGGFKVQMWATPRITTNDWWVFALGAPKKAFVVLERTPVEMYERTMDNSDSAKETKMEGLYWHKRTGYGVATPYQVVKVDN